LSELAWAAMFDMAEDPVEIGYAVKAAGETDFRYALTGFCHGVIGGGNRGHTLAIDF